MEFMRFFAICRYDWWFVYPRSKPLVLNGLQTLIAEVNVIYEQGVLQLYEVELICDPAVVYFKVGCY